MMSNLLVSSAALVLCFVSCRNAIAQIEFDRFFPPMVAAGTTTTLKAEGKFPAWPVEIYCDRSDFAIEPGPQSGDITVTIPANAPHGVAWLRLSDKRSASKLTPLLIEPIPAIVEVEPNNGPQDPQAITMPTAISGRLAKAGDVDGYTVDVKQGQTLVASVVAHQVLRSPMDAVLQIIDLEGNVLAQSDDERGIDPQLVYECTEDQQLIVRLFAFPETPTSTIGFAGAASFIYVLRLTTGPICDHCLPFANVHSSFDESHCFGWNLDSESRIRTQPPTDISPAIAYVPGVPGWQWVTSGRANTTGERPSNQDVAASIPAMFSGHIAAPGEVDHYRFTASKGIKYRAKVHSLNLGFKLDSVLRVLDPTSGKELAKNDDASRTQYDAAVDFTAPSDSDFELQISDLAESGGLRHAYTVLIEELQPSVALRVSQERFFLEAGKELEIPVSIERKHGFSSKLEISAHGLPSDIVAQAPVSEPKGKSATSVKLILKAENDSFTGHCRFEIKAVEVESDFTRQYLCEHDLRPPVTVARFWLTIAPKK